MNKKSEISAPAQYNYKVTVLSLRNFFGITHLYYKMCKKVIIIVNGNKLFYVSVRTYNLFLT